MRRQQGFLAAVCIASLFTANAHAAFVSYVLDQSNALSDGVHYAQVTIDDHGTTDRLTFTVSPLAALTSIAGANFGIQEFGFNVVGLANPLADASATNAQWELPAEWSAKVSPPPNQLDGFGRFEVSVSATGSDRQRPLSSSLFNTGLTLGSFAEFSTNVAAQGHVYFAAHVTGFDASGVTSAYFGGSTLTPVPLPAASWLLVSALGGFGLMRRRTAG